MQHGATTRSEHKGRQTELPRGAVLVATELGDSGSEAIARGDEWATLCGLPLVVVHVALRSDPFVPLLPHEYRPDLAIAEVPRHARNVRDQVAAHTARRTSDFDIVIERGSPHAAIVRLAEEIAPALLVLGSSQKSSLERMLLSSIAEQIVRHAPCSVMVARRQVSEGPVLVATDFSDAAMVALEAAREHATKRRRELVLLHCLDVFQPVLTTFEPAAAIDATTLGSLRDAARELGGALLAKVGVAGSVLVEVGDPARMITAKAAELGAAMVVVATHGRTGFSRMALGSVAESVVRSARSHVLVVRPSALGRPRP